MNSKEFTELFHTEKEQLLKLYFSDLSATLVGTKIKKLDLDKEQLTQLEDIVNDVLSEALYGILLGLNGESTIGNVQQTYTIHDENGEPIKDSDEIGV